MILIVFLLEEPSARDLLEGLLPKLLPTTIEVRYIIFEGKQDLEKNMARRIRGWLTPNTHFVVLRDQDAGECLKVKRRLRERAEEAGRPDTLIRVACKELESWVLGDLRALGEAFHRPAVESLLAKSKYRNPDALTLPVKEIRSLVGDYQKRDGARRVGPLLEPGRNQSTSFRAFCEGIRRLVRSLVAAEDTA